MDLRKSLFGSIVLSGGSTLTKGFGDRLLHEVQRLAVKDMRIKIFAPPERKYTTWIGGSILAGLSTFKKVSTLVAHSKEKKLGGAKNGSVSLLLFPHKYTYTLVFYSRNRVYGFLCGFFFSFHFQKLAIY